MRFLSVVALLALLILPASQAVAASLRAGVTSAAPAGLAAEPGVDPDFFKFDVTEDGLYRLSYADLQAAGLPVDTLVPTTFQLFEQGVELAIYVAGEGDGSFDPGDFILFYGRKVDTQYSDTNVYWLTYGVQAGLRMATRDVTPAGAPALSDFPASLHLEENLLYKGDLPKTGIADRWYWEQYASSCNWVFDPDLGIWVCEPIIPVLDYPVDLVSVPSTSEWAELRAGLRGNSAEFQVDPDHHVVFFVNGHVVGEGAWDDTDLLSFDNDLPVAGAGSFDWEGNPDPSGNCVLTSAGGNYVFSGLAAGDYVVDVALVNFYGGVLDGWSSSPRDVGQPTPANQANDLATDSDGALPTRDAGVTLTTGQVFLDLDFGFTSPVTGVVPGITQTVPFTPDGSAAVGDRVWYDENGDGIQDAGEPGIENALVCLYSDDGNGYFNGPIRFSQDFLIQGTNVISYTAPQDSGASSDSGYTNWLELDYRSGFVATADELAFTVADTGTWSATITGVTSGQVWLVDISDPQAPVLLTGGSLATKAVTADLSFQDTTAGTTGYWAAGESALRTPSNLRADAPSDLRNPANQADWIILSHPDFLVRPITTTVGPPAFPAPTVVTCPPYPQEQDTTYFECLSPPEQLARHRDTWGGLTTMVVDVTDVYDQFNGGVVHPEALHQFALYMRDNWADPDPRFLVLVGDGTYDPRPYLSDSPPTYIPPYLAPVDLIIGEVAGLNRIVSEWSTLDSQPRVPFMGLGLLPANSPAEAQTMVDKIIGYDTSSVTDGWNMNVAYVADDKDIAGDFPDHLNGVADNPALLPDDYTDNKIYYKVNYATPDDTTNAALAAINNGSLFVNYAGHGSITAWAGERLLDLGDVASMTNSDRLSIFLPMTCLEGQYIAPHLDALAETLLRHEGGGVVATWSATGRGVSTGHQALLEGFYDAIFNYDKLYLGDITTFAKQALYDSGSIFQDLLDTYLIFGDPATAPKVQQADLAVSITTDSPGWEPGQALTLTIQYSNTGVLSGTNALLDVTLPPELINWNWSGEPGVNLVSGTTWSLPDLPPGGNGTLIITGQVDPQAGSGTTLDFAAEASTDALESHLGDNSAFTQGSVASNTASISGTTWVDSNGNGAIDAGELMLSGVSILVRNSSGAVVASPVTTQGGTYSVTGLAAGDYTVEAGDATGFVHVSPSSVAVTLADGEAATVNFSYGATTGVDVQAFTVQRQDGVAVITWMTANENGLLGFNLYRSQQPDDYGIRINGDLVPAAGDGMYQYVDGDAGTSAHFYWIEAVDQAGNQFIGPVYTPARQAFRMFMPSVVR